MPLQSTFVTPGRPHAATNDPDKHEPDQTPDQTNTEPHVSETDDADYSEDGARADKNANNKAEDEYGNTNNEAEDEYENTNNKSEYKSIEEEEPPTTSSNTRDDLSTAPSTKVDALEPDPTAGDTKPAPDPGSTSNSSSLSSISFFDSESDSDKASTTSTASK